MTTIERPSVPADPVAEKLRGFGPIGILSTLVIFASGPILEPLGGLLVLAWAYRTPRLQVTQSA